jgi:hypothetical protein
MNLSYRRVGTGLLLLPCLAALAGCDRGPKMHQVRGHVFYKDGTVPKAAVAVVVFQPKQGSKAEVRRSASGAIKSDGSFEMWSRKAGDGVYEGEYDVGFTVLKAVMDPQPLIQEKYTKPGGAGLSVTVDRNIDDLKFEIEPLPGVKGAPPTSGG